MIDIMIKFSSLASLDNLEGREKRVKERGRERRGEGHKGGGEERRDLHLEI